MSPLYTIVSKKIISVSDISAVNLIVGWNCEAVCLQEKFFYFVSVYVPHCSDAPNDRFLSTAFNPCLKLSGVLLKLCT